MTDETGPPVPHATHAALVKKYNELRKERDRYRTAYMAIGRTVRETKRRWHLWASQFNLEDRMPISEDPYRSRTTSPGRSTSVTTVSSKTKRVYNSSKHSDPASSTSSQTAALSEADWAAGINPNSTTEASRDSTQSSRKSRVEGSPTHLPSFKSSPPEIISVRPVKRQKTSSSGSYGERGWEAKSPNVVTGTFARPSDLLSPTLTHYVKADVDRRKPRTDEAEEHVSLARPTAIVLDNYSSSATESIYSSSSAQSQSLDSPPRRRKREPLQEISENSISSRQWCHSTKVTPVSLTKPDGEPVRCDPQSLKPATRTCTVKGSDSRTKRGATADVVNAHKSGDAPHIVSHSRFPLNGETPDPRPQKGIRNGRMRQRRLSNLGLADFCLNPNANHGVDFAFSEVVRGKAARRQLPACVDPDCCGGPLKTFAKHCILEFDSDKTGYADKVDRHAAGTSEVVQRGQVQAFADRFGKHRGLHRRAASPPGFWRTEMPSTQELEEDWRQAAMMEKKKIEERYAEALKPNGKWNFRDEAQARAQR